MAKLKPDRHDWDRAKSMGRTLLPIVLVLGIVVYFLIKKPTNKITVEEGGKFTQIKKTSRWYTLFTEVGVENRGGDLGAYTRLGARIEF